MPEIFRVRWTSMGSSFLLRSNASAIRNESCMVLVDKILRTMTLLILYQLQIGEKEVS